MIKSRKIKWMEHTTHKRMMRNGYKILVRKYEGKRTFGRPKHRCILEKHGRSVWTGYMWLRIMTSGWILQTRKWIFRFHKRQRICKFLNSMNDN
jgi:hypothetical protein